LPLGRALVACLNQAGSVQMGDIRRPRVMPPLETRLSLIVRLKCEQDELAWRDFIGQYEKFLQQIVRRQGVPEALVPDATQQILMAISRSLETWKDDGNPGSFRRWMHTVARHVVVRFMTRERKQTAAAGGSDPLGLLNAVESPPDRDLLQRYEHELIVWAAEQVRHEFLATSWAAFWATTIEHRAVEDVARELQVSPGSIYMSRSRIMASIRKKIREVME
jgi:RNA polymerase sigma-70 factor (ECF subfamily)